MLPPWVNENRCNNIWENDQEFNRRISQNQHFSKHDAKYKTITRK